MMLLRSRYNSVYGSFHAMVSDEVIQAEVKYLNPKKITRNDDNPRILFYEDKLDILKHGEMYG